MARSILSFCLKLELGGQTTSLILFSKFSRFESLLFTKKLIVEKSMANVEM